MSELGIFLPPQSRAVWLHQNEHPNGIVELVGLLFGLGFVDFKVFKRCWRIIPQVWPVVPGSAPHFHGLLGEMYFQLWMLNLLESRRNVHVFLQL
jgi:hypothetical protein